MKNVKRTIEAAGDRVWERGYVLRWIVGGRIWDRVWWYVGRRIRDLVRGRNER